MYIVSEPCFDICFVDLSLILYVTDGAVRIGSAENSCCKRWENTSKCNKPRNPSLHPCPKAGLEISIFFYRT